MLWVSVELEWIDKWTWNFCGLAAGNNFGLAFEANIWNMPGIADAVIWALKQIMI